MVETIAKSEYDLCDQENSNLRRIIAFAAQHMPRDKVIELRDMIRQPIDDGGAVEDLSEEERESIRKLHAAADKLCDAVDLACSAETDAAASNLIGKASYLANALRGLVNEDARDLAPNLYDVREATP